MRQAYRPCFTDEDPEAQRGHVTYETHSAGKGTAETGAGRDQSLPEGNGCELFGDRASFVLRQEPRAEEVLPSLALRLS